MTTVPELLAHLQESAPWQHELFLELRKLVFACFPTTAERIIYGGIMFSLDGEDFGGIFPRKAHVSFEFGRGSSMRDPAHRLEGQGQHRRHLKLTNQGDITAKEVAFYLQQAV